MAGAMERQHREGERDVALAHTTALFTRAKKLERLDHYLKPRAPRKTKTPMLDRLRSIAARTAAL